MIVYISRNTAVHRMQHLFPLSINLDCGFLSRDSFLQIGIKIDGKSKLAKPYISGVIGQLETIKKTLSGHEALTTEIVAQAYLENYAVKLFNWDDTQVGF